MPLFVEGTVCPGNVGKGVSLIALRRMGLTSVGEGFALPLPGAEEGRLPKLLFVSGAGSVPDKDTASLLPACC